MSPTDLRIASAVVPIVSAIVTIITVGQHLLVTIILSVESLVLIVLGVWTWFEIAKIERSLRVRRKTTEIE